MSLSNSLTLHAQVLLFREDNQRRTNVDLACDALANIGPDAEAAVPILIELLADEREHTNFGAWTALDAIGEPAIPALKKASKSPNKKVAKDAAVILDRLQ